ncbi:unnamed protein product [Rotaria socialis]|uniref:Uncharacterized protein n=1 Tax=Rotaria socialis TaxID=392032 RepID=A0A817VX62_9BILA|nr:unnamed protein product [Rotaria socialis]CAF4640485.1 unnamed protein product [Rotaria socialis]
MTSVVHSMVHVPQTLKDFGPVQNYSTFNFESVIAELDTMDYASPLHLFICRMFCSKRQALPRQVTTKQNKSFRLGRKLDLPNDHIAMVYLRPKTNF